MPFLLLHFALVRGGIGALHRVDLRASPPHDQDRSAVRLIAAPAHASRGLLLVQKATPQMNCSRNVLVVVDMATVAS
ncbi:hypothetical protein RM53_15590 [Brevundimonas nasdae]|uniref:Uncharacterized protein n=1 Tax=Brevundimonas nasdae TaxID=172043 RepID=A0A0B4C268_9CAUL|nr:hypothetical protein RM53_15590 [Brevundimonas nasdae]